MAIFTVSASAVMCVALLTACDLPHDPEGTYERVRGSIMRVGLSEWRPWVVRDDNDQPSGIEVELIEQFATELDSEIRWYWGTYDALLSHVEQRQLDLMAGGLTDATPWATRVALTRPYFVEPPKPDTENALRHVMALPAGENRWLVTLEKFLFSAQSERAEQWRSRLASRTQDRSLEAVAP